MRRFCGFLVIVASIVAIIGCSSSPVATSGAGVVRYGAGSIEDGSTSSSSQAGSAQQPSVSKAAAPARLQKVKNDEVLAQAKMQEGELDEKLAALDFAGALTVYDSIADLLGPIPSAANQLQSVRQKVETALDSILIEPVSNPAETVAGTAFKKDFAVRVSVVSGDQKKPLPSFAFTVAYPGAAEDGIATTETAPVMTKDDGLATFTAPAPARSGKGKLVFSSTLTSRDPLLSSVIAKRMEGGKLALAFPHIASSNAKSYATTISILDFDRNGKPVNSVNYSATTLLKPLVQRGFRRIGMADFQSQLASGDDAVVLKAAKNLFGNGVQRFIFGTTKVDVLEQAADGTWLCTVSAKVTVWDFTADREVYTTTLTRTVSGKTDAAALEAARTKLAGTDLVDDLVYNM
jgi:hypothetical protein